MIQTIVIGTVLCAFGGPSGAAVVEQLIAVIDGEPYTLSNVRTYAKAKLGRSFPAGDLKQIEAGDQQVLEQFVTDKLIEAEVREAGIQVSDADVDRYIEQVKKKNRLSDEDLKTALSREGAGRGLPCVVSGSRRPRGVALGGRAPDDRQALVHHAWRAHRLLPLAR
jgi:parvulin-like peptidyl-prolyl isomerase